MIFRDTDYFNDGIFLPAGGYTVTYQHGSFAKSPRSDRHFVGGYNVVTKSGPGQPSVLLCAAPCITDPANGYCDESEARSVNEGISVSFTLETPAAVFLERSSELLAFCMPDSPVPTWSIDPIE